MVDRFMISARRLFTLLALPLLLAACSRQHVTDYTIPKEKDPEMPGMAAAAPAAGDSAPVQAAAPSMADTAVPTAQGPGLAWTAPADWKAKPASAMRKGSYDVPLDDGTAADLSVTAFPGDVGGMLANVNRWRGQVQLSPVDEAGLAASVSRIDSNGLSFTVVDLSGGPQRILGAIVPYGNGTWFFKIEGPQAAVAKVKPAFLDFLRTVKPAQP